MTIFPTPFLGRSPFYKGPFNHVAMSRAAVGAGGVISIDLAYRVALDPTKWKRGLLRGDITKALRSDGPVGACFVPAKIVPFKGMLIAAGGLRAPGNTRAGIYILVNGAWNRALLSNDALNPSSSDIADVAANDDYVVALGRNGVLHYWDGVSPVWSSRTDLPVGASVTTNQHMAGVGISAGGVVCVGAYTNANGTPGSNLVVTATSPAAAFAARSIPSMNIPRIVGRGNVIAVAASTGGNPSIITAPLANLTAWTSTGFNYGQQISILQYNGARWVGGYGYNKAWIASPNGTAGWAVVTDPAKQPWGATTLDHPTVNSGFVAGGKFHINWGYNGFGNDGGIAISADGDAWDRISNEDAGLAKTNYAIGSLLAA